MKDSNKILNRLKRLVQFFSIRPSCLRKIGATSSRSSNQKSNLLNQLAGIETWGEVWGYSHEQRDFILALASQKDNARSHLSLQLVNELPHSLNILPIHLGRKDLHASYLFDQRKEIRDFLG